MLSALYVSGLEHSPCLVLSAEFWALPQIQPRRYFHKLPLQANFYPMPTMAYIQDSQHRLTLHSAQALGVTSLDSGQYPAETSICSADIHHPAGVE